MAEREFEAWILSRFTAGELKKARIGSVTKKRDAKGALRRLVPRYKPTTHQLDESRKIDIARARQQPSFSKLVRSLAEITGATIPAEGTAEGKEGANAASQQTVAPVRPSDGR